MGYVPRPTCVLPNPISPGGKIRDAGDTWVCPNCTRVWTMAWIYQFGWVIQPEWVTTTPAGGQSLAQQIAAINARGPFVSVIHVARADAVTVALGGSVDVTFTWPTAFTDTAYSYEAPLPPTLLGKVTVTEKTKTAAALTLTLKSNTIAVAAFTWEATAWKTA